MTNPRDDSDGFGHDPAIATLYRTASVEMPGAAADAAILAQARAAAARMRPAALAANDASWSKRWRAPLALAACAVLTVGIVTRIGVESPDAVPMSGPVVAEAPSSAVPAPAQPASSQAAPAAAADARPAMPAESLKPVEASKPVETSKLAQSSVARGRASGGANSASDMASVPAPAPAPAPQSTSDGVVAQERKQRAESGVQEQPALAKVDVPVPFAAASPAAAPPVSGQRELVGERAASGAAGELRRDALPAPTAKPAARPLRSSAENVAAQASASPAPAAAPAATAAGSTSAVGSVAATPILSVAAEAQLPPQRWLAYIIELRRAGLPAAADASLTRLRARFPALDIPAEAQSPATPFPADAK